MMRRFLCFSLCLGLMVSACKKKSLEESVNKAITQAKAGAGGAGSGGGDGGGDGGGGDDGATTVTKKNKEAVLKACLPNINTKMIELWKSSAAGGSFFLRRNTVWKTTPAVPLVVLYTQERLPLYFAWETEVGLGKDAATVTKNLNEMAASEVIQNQFVARDGNAPGWRVHISQANTDVEIPASEPGQPPVAPDDSGIIIYDRENLKIDELNGTQSIINSFDLRAANHPGVLGGWFDCVVDETTQAVTLKYTEAPLTEA